MTTNKQILDNIGDELIQEVDDRISAKNLNDTGDAVNSLKRKSTESNLKINGLHYIGALSEGRKPGKFPWADGDTKEDNVMLRYAKRNNINFEIGGKSIGFKSTAYLMGKGIAEKGTVIYRDHSKGIKLEEIRQMGIDKINKRIPENIIINVKSDIRNIFQGIQ